MWTCQDLLLGKLLFSAKASVIQLKIVRGHIREPGFFEYCYP